MKRKTKIFATTLVSLVVCVILAFAGMKIYADSKTETIPDGVYVDSVSIGGKTAEEAQELVDEYVKSLSEQKFVLEVDGHKVKTTLSELGFEVVENDYIEQASNIGKTGNVIKRYKELKDIENETLVYNLEFTIDHDSATAFIEDKCTKYEVEPVDATITRENGEFVITEEVMGRTINVEDTIEKIKVALSNDWDFGTLKVEAVVADAEPDCTAELLSRCKDVLGEYSTSYTSSSSNRAANLDNAAKLIDGSVVLPGEEFSTSDKLVPFTEDNGYQAAGAYQNGKVVDSIGGGVCQAATTLYNALLLAELEITERYNHSMIVSYVDAAMDAAISDGVKDLKFKNDTDVPIYIEAYTSGRTIYFKIYGEETRDTENRTVEYKSEITETIQPGDDVVTEDSSLPSSYRCVEQAAHVGYKAILWKYVYVNGELESKEQVNYSSYAAEPAYVVVGTKEEEKEDDTEEEEEEEEEDSDSEEESSEDSDSSTKKDEKKSSSSDTDSSSKKSSSSTDSTETSSSSSKSSTSTSSKKKSTSGDSTSTKKSTVSSSADSSGSEEASDDTADSNETVSE